ncbi:hypothetical protein SELMODRAFT_10629, partial [Selaginella moellendorffii]
DALTWTCILQAFAQRGVVEKVAVLIERVPCHSTLCMNTSISAFAKTGHFDQAKSLFSKMPERDTVTINVMIQAFASEGSFASAKHLFDHGATAARDMITWNTIVSMYSRNGFHKEASDIFMKMPRCNLITCNSILKSLSIDDARDLFRKFEERDVITWNTMLEVYAQNKEENTARTLFSKMPFWDLISFTVFITVFASNGRVEEAKRLFDQVPAASVVTWNVMVSAYAQNGHLGDSLQVLSRMPMKSLVTFSVMIGIYAQCGDVFKAKEAFESISTGREHSVVSVTLGIAIHGRSSNLESAKKCFDYSPERNLVAWNCLMAVLVQNEDYKRTKAVFDRMPSWDTISWSTVLVYSSHDLDGSESLFESIPEKTLSSWNAILSVHAEHGDLSKVIEVFQRMKARDVISWTCLITAHSHAGDGVKSLKVFQEMVVEGVRPNRISFMSLLVACSHLGWIDQALECLWSMQLDYGIDPAREHYSCVVDMLARTGQLTEAQQVISFLPGCPVAWGALLGACKLQCDVGVGEDAAKHVFELDPSNTAPHVLLQSLH